MKIAICDDDKKYIDDVISLLGDVECEIFPFSSGYDLLKSPFLSIFNLIFLDIVMSEMDGLETLKHLSGTSAYIIFMSTTSDRLRELFHRNVLGFLDKPINESEFHAKFNEFLNIKKETPIFSFEMQGVLHNIPQNEILYFENWGHYIHLHTLNDVFIFKENISAIWRTLESDITFAMPNRSFIINLKFSSLLSKTSVLVKDTVIPIGRTRKEDTQNRLFAYVGMKGI